MLAYGRARAFLFTCISRRTLQTSLRIMATSEEPVARVRVPESGEKLTVAFADCWGQDKQLQLERDRRENVSKTLERIILKSQYLKTSGSLTKRAKKRKRQDDGKPPILIEAHLYTPTGELVKPDTPNVLAWEEGNLLVVGSVRYRVCVNIPTVLSLELPSFLQSGCPIVPEVSDPLTLTFPSHISLSTSKFRSASSTQTLASGSGFASLPKASQMAPPPAPPTSSSSTPPIPIGRRMRMLGASCSSDALRPHGRGGRRANQRP